MPLVKPDWINCSGIRKASVIATIWGLKFSKRISLSLDKADICSGLIKPPSIIGEIFFRTDETPKSKQRFLLVYWLVTFLSFYMFFLK